MDRSVLERKSVPELRDIASALQLTGVTKLRKAELIDAIISNGGEGDAQAPDVPDDDSARKVLPPQGRDGDDDAADSTSADDEESRDAAAGSSADGSDRDTSPVDSDDNGADADDSSDDADSSDDSGDDSSEDSGDDDSADADDDDSADDDNGDSGETRRRRTRSRDTVRRESGDAGSSDGSRDGDGADDDGDDGEDGRRGRGRRDRRRRNADRDDARDSSNAGGGDDTDGRGTNRGTSKDDAKNRSSKGDRKGGTDGGRNRGGGGRGNKGEDDPGEVRAGVLDILPEGYGFLRTTGYLPGERDVYVSQGQIRKQRLRRGDVVQGPIRQQRSNEKVPALHHVEKVNLEDLEANQVADRPEFADLPIVPLSSRIDLGSSDSVNARLIDLVAPQADGQRTVICVPPAADSAELLVELAGALGEARPESHVMVVCIDSRPEVIDAAAGEVRGEIIASTFDQAAEDHTQIAELAIERAKRLVELGHDVIVLLDSISRLARAYGVANGTGGRTVAPDIEAAALYPPKHLFAAARATEDHGSLTIVGTLLTGTGSVYDDVVQREFVRVANSTIVIDPDRVAQGVPGTVSVLDSSTYPAASVRTDDEAAAIGRLRASVAAADASQATMVVMDRLQGTASNHALLDALDGSPLTAATPGDDR